MKRSRMFILATVAFALSIAVTFVVYTALRNRLEPAGAMTQIIVAAHDVSLGARLTAADLRSAPWPREAPLKGSFHEIGELLGRGVIVSMTPNEPVLDSKLAQAGAGAGLATTIPEGMRAVGVKVDDVIGISGFVVPGSRVDVILSGSPDRDRTTQMSKVILENIQVLAAGQNVTRDGDGKPQDVQVVTLLVTPDDSQKLALAIVEGKIQLSLRNPMDIKTIGTSAVNSAGLYGKSSEPPPAPPTAAPVSRIEARAPVRVVQSPPPPAPVLVVARPRTVNLELIQGTRTETVTFGTKP